MAFGEDEFVKDAQLCVHSFCTKHLHGGATAHEVADTKRHQVGDNTSLGGAACRKRKSLQVLALGNGMVVFLSLTRALVRGGQGHCCQHVCSAPQLALQAQKSNFGRLKPSQRHASMYFQPLLVAMPIATSPAAGSGKPPPRRGTRHLLSGGVVFCFNTCRLYSSTFNKCCNNLTQFFNSCIQVARTRNRKT